MLVFLSACGEKAHEHSLNHNGICTDCGYCEADPGYTHAIPENQGVQNVIDRAYQLTDVEWTPIADMPGLKGNGKVITFEAGETYKGIPYSGVTHNHSYVGLNVSLETYLSALKSKNSVLYTENLQSTNSKAATFYGTVCSKFVQYALDVPGAYNTENMANVIGMETIAAPGDFTVDDIKLGDVVVHLVKHTTVCTDILYDAEGNVAFIEISEATYPTARRLRWTPAEFYEHFEGYTLCRYSYISQTPAPSEMNAQESYALMPRFGDKYNYKVSAQPAVVDVLKTGYDKAVILRDGAVVDKIILNGKTTFAFDLGVPGYIEMYLEKENGERSASVYACVVKSSAAVTEMSSLGRGKLTVEFDGSCGVPLYVQVGSAHAVFCNIEGKESAAEIDFSYEKVTSQNVRVAYQNEYGVYLSEWYPIVAFKNNPSTDPLLSQAEYFEGCNLTPSSAVPSVQEGKTGYFTYAMIPVKENETYDSSGATRMWFFDANKNPISTYNASKDSEIKYRFTVPEGAAYVSISYSPATKGTECIEVVHNYNNGSCLGCGKAES